MSCRALRTAGCVANAARRPVPCKQPGLQQADLLSRATRSTSFKTGINHGVEATCGGMFVRSVPS